jgi:hypothetical protein
MAEQKPDNTPGPQVIPKVTDYHLGHRARV